MMLALERDPSVTDWMTVTKPTTPSVERVHAAAQALRVVKDDKRAQAYLAVTLELLVDAVEAGDAEEVCHQAEALMAYGVYRGVIA